MSYVQVDSSLGDYISPQTGARVATAIPGGFPQFPQDWDGDGDGWQPWMAPDSPWSRRQRQRRGFEFQRGRGFRHGGARGGHGGGRGGRLGYTAQELAAHFRGVRELQRQQRGEFARGGQRGFFERGRMETHPFRLWGRHPMAPICTDPSCPMCTDPNYPWYNPNDPVCQAGGLSGLGYTAQELQAHFRNVRRLCASPGIWGNRGFEGLGCMGAVATSAPVIRGTLIKVGGPRPIGRPIPITNPVRIARSPGQHGQSWQHGQERHGQRLPGWGARGLHWNNRRGWARGANRWFPWNVSPVCSDPSSGFYNPEDPSCATGVNPVCSDPSYPGYNPNDPSCGGGTAALTAATSSDASAPTYSGGGHAMPSWIWLAGGALLLVLVMKK